MWLVAIVLDNVGIEQGSQTQSDSSAAWDSKKGLSGRIQKMEKITFKFSAKNLK